MANHNDPAIDLYANLLQWGQQHDPVLYDHLLEWGQNPQNQPPIQHWQNYDQPIGPNPPEEYEDLFVPHIFNLPRGWRRCLRYRWAEPVLQYRQPIGPDIEPEDHMQAYLHIFREPYDWIRPRRQRLVRVPEDFQPPPIVPDEQPGPAIIARPLGTRKQVYYEGRKREHPRNTQETDEAPKTSVYTIQPNVFTNPSPYNKFRLMTAAQRARYLNNQDSDEDLVAYLKTQAAFLPRSELLAIQLKYKGEKYLAQFDCSEYTRLRMHRILLNAVTQAMIVDDIEDCAVKIMNFHNRPRRNPLLVALGVSVLTPTLAVVVLDFALYYNVLTLDSIRAILLPYSRIFPVATQHMLQYARFQSSLTQFEPTLTAYVMKYVALQPVILLQNLSSLMRKPFSFMLGRLDSTIQANSNPLAWRRLFSRTVALNDVATTMRWYAYVLMGKDPNRIEFRCLSNLISTQMTRSERRVHELFNFAAKSLISGLAVIFTHWSYTFMNISDAAILQRPESSQKDSITTKGPNSLSQNLMPLIGQCSYHLTIAALTAAFA